MSLLKYIGFGGAQNQTPASELPDIFPFPFPQNDFIKTDLETIYARILTDTLERTQGLSENVSNLLWDNCLGSESQDGLVTMLAKAMVAKSDLYIVYRPDLSLVRQATNDERNQIKADYAKIGSSKLGIYITFKNYRRSDMLALYSGLEYCAIASLHKSANLSKAIQYKISKMRESISSFDSAGPMAQATEVAKALGKGRDVAIDAADVIETATPDVTAAEKSSEFIDRKRSFYLGLPASYITGLAPKGLGDTGEGDAKAVERGLKAYFFSIIKPVVEQLFGAKVTFKSEDFYGLSQTLEVLRTFEVVSDEFVSAENKQILLNKLLGLPADAKGDGVRADQP